MKKEECKIPQKESTIKNSEDKNQKSNENENENKNDNSIINEEEKSNENKNDKQERNDCENKNEDHNLNYNPNMLVIKVRRIDKPTDDRAFIDKLNSFEQESMKIKEQIKKQTPSKFQLSGPEGGVNNWNEYSDTVSTIELGIYRKKENPRYDCINSMFPLYEPYNIQSIPYENKINDMEYGSKMNNSSQQSRYQNDEEQNFLGGKYVKGGNKIDNWNPNPYSYEQLYSNPIDNRLSKVLITSLIVYRIQFNIDH